MNRPDRLTDGEHDAIREIEATAREDEEEPDEVFGEPTPASEVIYGFYHGGDPRKFSPDYECCSEKEIADHKAACKLWDDMETRGETPRMRSPRRLRRHPSTTSHRANAASARPRYSRCWR